MQDDSNGESSFEFVNKRGADEANNAGSASGRKPSVPAPAMAATSSPATARNLLSSVPPPSALPSFVMAQPPAAPPSSTGTPQSVTTNQCPEAIVPPVSSQPQSQIYQPAPTFSAAIPLSPGSEPILSPQEEQGPGGSLLGWMKGAVASGGILSRVAEKAKSSVDSMITTLDPQMKEFIYSGGDMDLIVASDKEVKISPVREAFQGVFGRATVIGRESQATMVAAQPVGFAAGCKAAEERISALRQSGQATENCPVVAVENFLLEISEDKWFDLGVLVLEDSVRKISLQTFTQLTPVPARVVERARVDTPLDYPLRWSGLSVPIGKLMAEHLQVTPGEWHQTLTGVSRREMLLQAAKALATLYKNSLPN